MKDLIQLVNIMDTKEEKEPSIEECETMLYEAFNRVMNKSHSTKYKLVKVEEPVKEEIQESEKEIWAAFVRAWNMRTPLTELKKIFTIQRKQNG